MEWASRFRIKLKNFQRFQLEQWIIAGLFFCTFLLIAHYTGLMGPSERTLFISLSLLFAIMTFVILNTKGLRFLTTQRQKVEKNTVRLGKLIKDADKRDSAVEEIQNMSLDPCFDEKPSPQKQEILAKIANAVSADKVSLFLPIENHLVRIGRWGIESADLEGLKIPLDRKSAIVKTFKTSQPIISANINSDPRFDRKLARLTGAKQAVCIPLTFEGETFGVLVATNKTEGFFGKEDVMHLKSIAFSIASRLKKISLEKGVGQRIEEEQKFLSEFAHHIKTPLTAAYGELELALTEKNENQRKKAIEFALGCLEKSAREIKEALDFYYTKTSKETYQKIDLHKILREICEVVCVLAEQKTILVNLNGKDQIFTTGDRNKILQAVTNVMENAVNYTPRGGRITIDLKKRNGMAVVVISDTGVGLPQKDIPRVFDKFWRGQTANNKEGSGLGLSITKSIVEAHGGTIGLTSRVGGGTKVQISLPLADSKPS
ncbi:hypothetical protein A2Z23_01415 [Candidatus Curtissbacteria bacterium RBG_16_39_7]|uniref:histidine kinase n=1 Tax=Candidatus Curtissbacteria bacterium RBG_16_39_7 TaxID=1797707 RepID=A0A1F5G519_9BACT|nr:MAG: hypothetical protein A2Z23_01415 [Candidatus Curtissbacteria bacterium RBG_16_39_7]